MMRKPSTAILVITMITVLSHILGACGSRGTSGGDSITDTTDSDAYPAGIIDKTPDPRWALHLDSMPDEGCVKLVSYPPAGSLRKNFCDSNYLHYAAGKQYGIEPVTTLDDILNTDKTLIKIYSCREYFVDSLRHSYPYLVPRAARLLSDIGRTFNDSLRARGGGNYRLKVTSILRTDQSIKRLRRVNRIAVDSSAHRFATTFDISYSQFICSEPTGPHRTQADLKNLLAEVLHDFHCQGRCLIVYERKQACFHITVIDSDYVRPLPPKPDDEPDDNKKHDK